MIMQTIDIIIQFIELFLNILQFRRAQTLIDDKCSSKGIWSSEITPLCKRISLQTQS